MAEKDKAESQDKSVWNLKTDKSFKTPEGKCLLQTALYKKGMIMKSKRIFEA